MEIIVVFTNNNSLKDIGVNLDYNLEEQYSQEFTSPRGGKIIVIYDKLPLDKIEEELEGYLQFIDGLYYVNHEYPVRVTLEALNGYLKVNNKISINIHGHHHYRTPEFYDLLENLKSCKSELAVEVFELFKKRFEYTIEMEIIARNKLSN